MFTSQLSLVLTLPIPGDGQAELSLVVAVIKMHQDDANVTRTANDSHPIQN